MANTTSGQLHFDKTFAIDEIVEEAYERIGMQGVSGYQLRLARRSLNIMFQEWGNRGLHYWEVANNSFTLVDGQAEYTMFRSTDDGTSSATAVYGVDDILEAVIEMLLMLIHLLQKLIDLHIKVFQIKLLKEHLHNILYKDLLIKLQLLYI